MTGYHAWVFPFIALVFHLPIFLRGCWSWRLEARIVAMIMLFWVIEHALWFVLNPAFGGASFQQAMCRGINTGGWACRWTIGSPRHR